MIPVRHEKKSLTGQVKQVSSSSLTRTLGEGWLPEWFRLLCCSQTPDMPIWIQLREEVWPQHSAWLQTKYSAVPRHPLCSAGNVSACTVLGWAIGTSLSALQEDGWSFVCIPSWDSLSVLKGRAPLIMFHQLALPSRFQPTFDLWLVMQSSLASSQFCNQMSVSGFRQWASWEGICCGKSLILGSQDHKLLPRHTHLDLLYSQCEQAGTSWHPLQGRIACGQLWVLHRSLWWNLKSS